MRTPNLDASFSGVWWRTASQESFPVDARTGNLQIHIESIRSSDSLIATVCLRRMTIDDSPLKRTS